MAPEEGGVCFSGVSGLSLSLPLLRALAVWAGRINAAGGSALTTVGRALVMPLVPSAMAAQWGAVGILGHYVVVVACGYVGVRVVQSLMTSSRAGAKAETVVAGEHAAVVVEVEDIWPSVPVAAGGRAAKVEQQPQEAVVVVEKQEEVVVAKEETVRPSGAYGTCESSGGPHCAWEEEAASNTTMTAASTSTIQQAAAVAVAAGEEVALEAALPPLEADDDAAAARPSGPWPIDVIAAAGSALALVAAVALRLVYRGRSSSAGHGNGNGTSSVRVRSGRQQPAEEPKVLRELRAAMEEKGLRSAIDKHKKDIERLVQVYDRGGQYATVLVEATGQKMTLLQYLQLSLNSYMKTWDQVLALCEELKRRGPKRDAGRLVDSVMVPYDAALQSERIDFLEILLSHLPKVRPPWWHWAAAKDVQAHDELVLRLQAELGKRRRCREQRAREVDLVSLGQ